LCRTRVSMLPTAQCVPRAAPKQRPERRQREGGRAPTVGAAVDVVGRAALDAQRAHADVSGRATGIAEGPVRERGEGRRGQVQVMGKAAC
jgi:hypothetical protein